MGAPGEAGPPVGVRASRHAGGPQAPLEAMDDRARRYVVCDNAAGAVVWLWRLKKDGPQKHNKLTRNF